ncbi:hypothetical protein MLD38_035593 [Melastoma candidum]|uniref:Uncharacterized protein n=1 Tax=Melastoma candidum TaxID=119954 RepID=A0ACB9LH31_9MYRT|nr:hypothetical protein MLD38_035593 [Melastoma candidum]
MSDDFIAGCLRMRRLMGLRFPTIQATKPPHFPSSSLHGFTKTPIPDKPKQTHTESVDPRSLFSEIAEIIGDQFDGMGDSLNRTGNGTELAGRRDQIEGPPLCSRPVCGNAAEGEGDALVKCLLEAEVSALVDKITRVVRAENREFSMKERLESTGFCSNLESDVVEKVLKRCFKVPHLALRFFDWVKRKEWFRPTTAVCNTVLYIAGGERRFGMVEALVEEMEKNSCEKDIKTWTILLDRYGKAKLVGKALSVFEDMKKNGFRPDGVVYRKILRVLCVAGKGDIAMEFYKEMIREDMSLNLNLYQMLLNCVAKSGDAATAYKLVNDMVTGSQIPEHLAYSQLLKSFCMCQRITEALELIRSIKNRGLHMEANYLNTLVKGLSLAGQMTDAIEIVEIMKRKVWVDVRTYGSIIRGYLKVNDVSRALRLFKEMKDYGLVPDVLTYTALIQNLFKLSEYEKAKGLYNEILDSGQEPDDVVIMAMVAGLVSHNKSEALEFLRSMEKKGSDRNRRRTYLSFIRELFKVASNNEILDVLQEMHDLKIPIPDELFCRVLFHFERNGNVEQVENLKQLKARARLVVDDTQASAISAGSCPDPEREINDPVYGSLEPIYCQIPGTHLEKNLVHVEEICPVYGSLEPIDCQIPGTPLEKNLVHVEEICHILLSSKEWCSIQQRLENCTINYSPELVLEILRHCKLQGNIAFHFFYWVAKQDGYRHTADTYNMVIKAAGCAKSFSNMRSLFHEMRRNGYAITSHTWTIMILCYGRMGMTEIALRIFKEMKASGVHPNGSCYKYLILSLCGRKGRKVDDAVKLFREMINYELTPDKELVETYLACLCETNKLPEARRCVSYLLKVGFTSSLGYSMYVRALCRARKLKEALMVIDESGPDREALEKSACGSIVHALLQLGKLDEALSKIDEMKQAGVTPTIHTYTSLMTHFFKGKETEKALEIFQTMQCEGHEPTAVTYTALIRGYINVGKFNDARDVFEMMKARGPSPDFRTYSVYMDGLCRVGKSEEALEILKEMRGRGIVPSAVNFRTVFFGLNREGKNSLARCVLQEKSLLAKERKFVA